MKKTLIILLISAYTFGQENCKIDWRFQLTTDKCNQAVVEYEQRAKLYLMKYGMWNSDFSKRMGIYLVTEYTNKVGQPCFKIEICYDTRYKLFLPKGYAFAGRNHTLLLVYQGDENGNMIDKNNDDVHIKCYDDIVQDRVFISPKAEVRKILAPNNNNHSPIVWIDANKDDTWNAHNPYAKANIVFKDSYIGYYIDFEND